MLALTVVLAASILTTCPQVWRQRYVLGRHICRSHTNCLAQTENQRNIAVI